MQKKNWARNNRAFCDCGNPATVMKTNQRICERCAAIESRFYAKEQAPDTTHRGDTGPAYDHLGLPVRQSRTAFVQPYHVRLPSWGG